MSRNESGRFGALKSDSTHHFFRNACTKSGSLRFSVFRLLTDFVCLYTYEFWLSLCKIVRSSVIVLLPLFGIFYLFSITIKKVYVKTSDVFLADNSLFLKLKFTGRNICVKLNLRTRLVGAVCELWEINIKLKKNSHNDVFNNHKKSDHIDWIFFCASIFVITVMTTPILVYSTLLHISDIAAISGTPEFEINTTGTTSGAGTAYPSRAHALTPGF